MHAQAAIRFQCKRDQDIALGVKDRCRAHIKQLRSVVAKFDVLPIRREMTLLLCSRPPVGEGGRLPQRDINQQALVVPGVILRQVKHPRWDGQVHLQRLPLSAPTGPSRSSSSGRLIHQRGWVKRGTIFLSHPTQSNQPPEHFFSKDALKTIVGEVLQT
jgi:hypothetical protein